jgi:hypothetical protein
MEFDLLPADLDLSQVAGRNHLGVHRVWLRAAERGIGPVSLLEAEDADI